MKMMIVDDEYIVRRGMKKIIRWDEWNVTIVGEAENANEAIETARRVLPDIVICDICLPGMKDGFDVIEEVRRIVPWVQFIMITAHSDRKHIRRAIHEQVCDYLYKPTTVEDIKAAVGRASLKVDDYMKKMHHDLKYHNFITENMDILREKFINQLVSGTLPEEKALQDAESLKINLTGPCWRVLVVWTDSEESIAAMQQLVLCLESWHPTISKAEVDPRVYLLLLNCGDKEQTSEIQTYIDRFPPLRTVLSPLYQHLRDLSDFHILNQLSESAASNPSKGLTVDLRRIRESVYEAVKYHDSVKEVERYFLLFLEEMKKRQYSEARMLHECRHILDTICTLANIDRESLGEISDLETLRTEFARLCESLKEIQKSPLDDVSRKALYYIRKRYQEDLSLEQVAAELFMSSSYLSRVLKEQTGYGFGHWLNHYRIEAAKEMLKRTEDSVEQVAGECGYHSYRIFSENFRKYTGRTATAWREENRDN